MGIEDPIWGRIIIVLGFLSVLLSFLYISRVKGKTFFSKLSNNEFLKLDETISISNISKASLISVKNDKFLIVHGRGQSPSIINLSNNNISKENLLHNHEDIKSW